MRQTVKQWKALRDYAKRPAWMPPLQAGPACQPGAPKPRAGGAR